MMYTPEEIKKIDASFELSLWDKIFLFPRTLFHKLTKNRYNGPYYSLNGNKITRKADADFTELIVFVDDIKEWTVIPVMGIDIVRISMQNGEELSLDDKHNDLIEALKTAVPDKQFGDELDLLGS